MTAADIARELQGRRSGTEYVARCPSHQDRNPSLSIRDAGNQLLVYCHAGCSQDAVIAALRGRGLWPGTGGIVATYPYSDERGELLYEVVRFAPKEFRVRRPNGRGGWTWGLGDVRRVLYRLPDVIKNPIIFLVEGERDVDTLRAWGFVGTTNVFGAMAQWLPEYSAALSGREVIILPDNDAPGWGRATRIARELLPVAAKVQVIGLEGAKDASEWFERGHSECELIALVEGCHAV